MAARRSTRGFRGLMAPTTQITESAFQTACAECADALAASSWTTARTKYAVAEAINAGLAVQVGRESMLIRRRETLEGLRKAIEVVSASNASASDPKRLTTTRISYG